MQGFLLAVGEIGVILLGCGLTLAGVSSLIESWGRKTQQHMDSVRELAARDVGLKIVQTYHWFSEDRDAMEAVKAVGRQLQDGGYWFNADAARKRWRETKSVPADSMNTF